MSSCCARVLPTSSNFMNCPSLVTMPKFMVLAVAGQLCHWLAVREVFPEFMAPEFMLPEFMAPECMVSELELLPVVLLDEFWVPLASVLPLRLAELLSPVAELLFWLLLGLLPEVLPAPAVVSWPAPVMLLRSAVDEELRFAELEEPLIPVELPAIAPDAPAPPQLASTSMPFHVFVSIPLLAALLLSDLVRSDVVRSVVVVRSVLVWPVVRSVPVWLPPVWLPDWPLAPVWPPLVESPLRLRFPDCG